MKPTNDLDPIESPYAQDSDGYLYRTAEQYLEEAHNNWTKGFEPLNALPATWYNALGYILTKHAIEVNRLLGSVYQEVVNVCLEKYTAEELDAVDSTQLLKSIKQIISDSFTIATDQIAGLVKSSATSELWKINVDATTGKMSLNKTNASTTEDGLMSKDDKAKLDNIQSGAQVNPSVTVHTAEPGWGQTQDVITVGDKTAKIKLPSNPTPGEATSYADGLMPASAMAKLEGIEEGAQVNPTVEPKNPTLDWGQTQTVAKIGSQDIKVTMPANPAPGIASSEAAGTIKLGFQPDAANKRYPVQLSDGEKAYVEVPWTDTHYSLPVANASELGGIRTGYEESGKRYAVKMSDGQRAYVEVPWTDTQPDLSSYATQEWVRQQGYKTKQLKVASKMPTQNPTLSVDATLWIASWMVGQGDVLTPAISIGSGRTVSGMITSGWVVYFYEE